MVKKKNPDPRYLLIIACSQRKRSDDSLLPAIERYDGVNFRVLHKAKREGYLLGNLDILILSAKYGLIEANTQIANYEQRMDSGRAKALKKQVVQMLRNYAGQRNYHEIYVDLGKDYLDAAEKLEAIFENSTIIFAEGRIGERLSKLKHWLRINAEKESDGS